MTLYTDEHRIFQQSIRKFAEKEILPHVDAWEEGSHFPSEIFPKLGAAGFLGILLDEQWGGVARDYSFASAWCEEFGRIPSVGFTTGVNMHALISAPALQRFGSPAAKEQFLGSACEGTAIGAYAFTEPGAGSDLTQVQTRAVRDGNDYVLNGSKIFITNGARADFVLTLAKTDPTAGYDGFTTFVIDTKNSGFAVARTLSKLGWHSSDTAELTFTDLRLSKEMVLGEVGKGWYQAMQSLEWERLMLTLAAVGGARACLEETVRYVNERKIFKQTIGSIEVNRTELARLASKLQAGEAFCHHCTRLLVEGRRARKEVSLAKRVVCQLAIELADYCLQLHGGYGYTTEFRPERWLRDLRLNTIGGGANEVMLKIAAGEVFR
ncbi:MAG: acyl-CoA dehydrogenase family protein [Bdellovibrionales bacterium]|nr:acyl-CoA dehydrogenase family protein [Bdellovibrionales bacterium]